MSQTLHWTAKFIDMFLPVQLFEKPQVKDFAAFKHFYFFLRKKNPFIISKKAQIHVAVYKILI